MVPRASGGGAGPAKDWTAGAGLIGAVLQLSSHRDAFGKSGCGGGDIPDKPMKLIIGGVVANALHVMYVQEEGHGTRWDVGPGDCWRGLVTRLRVLRRNISAIGESR